MEMLNIQLTSLPIWVKFYNIPLEYWTNTCLGYIASAVWKPLHMDSLTENRTRLSFARICIEVDLSSKFPKTARLNLGNGKCTTIRIEYPWVPQNCSHCQVFGHKISHCPVSKAPSVSVSGVDSCSKILHLATPGEKWRDGVDCIGTRQSIVIQDNIGVTIHEATISPMKHANRFEYIAIDENRTNEVAGAAFTDASTVTPREEVAVVASTGTMIPDRSKYSDSSPICDSFKQVKRIDELEW